MKWSKDETLKFVKLYRNNECLWNSTKPIYRNNQMRLVALQQIVDAMNIDGFLVTDARIKIKNLRNTYNQELQKIEKSIQSGKEGGDVYVPSMKWFQVMDDFMSKTKEKRNTASNLDYQASQYALEESSNETDLYGDGENTNWSLTEWTENDAQLIKIEACTPPHAEESTPCTSSSTGRKRRREETPSAASELCQVSSVTQPSDEDEFDVFGRYLALGLKKMPLHLALECETELQATLNRYRIKAVTPARVMTSTPRSSSSSN